MSTDGVDCGFQVRTYLLHYCCTTEVVPKTKFYQFRHVSLGYPQNSSFISLLWAHTVWSLPFLPSEEQWYVLSAAFHVGAMSSYQRKCNRSPVGLWLSLSIPHGAMFKILRGKNGVRLRGRLWALSMEFRRSPPKQTLITYLRWIKRMWLTTVHLLFCVTSKSTEVSLEVVKVVMVWVWALVEG